MKSGKLLFYYFSIFILCSNLTIIYAQAISTAKFKTQRIFQYDVINGSVQSSGKLISLIEINVVGLVAKQVVYNTDGSIITESINIYDDKNRMIESAIAAVPSNVVRKMKYTYEDSLIIRAVSLIDEREKIIIDYKYDERNHPVEIISSNADDNQTIIRSVNNYDSEGNIQEMITYDPFGSVIGKMNYLYDSNGQIIQKSAAKGEKVQRKTQSYDNLGNVVEETFYDEEGRIINKVIYKFNENGNIIEDSNEIPYANMKTRKTHRYNNDGMLIETVNYNKYDEPVKILRLEYEFY
ncbi:MAG: RHS repeat protein [Bacteroidetes bacterium]|nr:RHS repeat protein [Bacteroidota bacterium]